LSSSEKPKKNVAVRFFVQTKEILLSSWLNAALVMVPVGIAAEVAHLSPIVIFVTNAIAIVPLAGLLSHATESVAKRMGDTLGALMNVSFGNAVELIIFIIALTKDEFRIVQASILGSILANLLLILGMSFFLGGLRYREQIYNSTVTQMSACLLSLSVMSLLLPTAFHAAFAEDKQDVAEVKELQVSRGTSVILLLVYVLYLVFQLNSHAYMYQSTPQHIIDEESHPGPGHRVWDSSSDSSSSSSSDSDSDASTGTAARVKRAFKRGGKRHRKESFTSHSTDRPVVSRTASFEPSTPHTTTGSAILEGEEADIEDHRHANTRRSTRSSHSHSPHSHHRREHKMSRKEKKRARKEEKRERHRIRKENEAAKAEAAAQSEKPDAFSPRRVDFAVADVPENIVISDGTETKRPLFMNIPQRFSQSVFGSPSNSPRLAPKDKPVNAAIPRVKYGIRRTNSLPDRLNQTYAAKAAEPPSLLTRSMWAISPEESGDPVTPPTLDHDDDEKNISRTTAVILLLVSTGLVAVCAEFLVGSINEVTSNTALGETFVGLIILPVVGNAAEHVTAVTVATKNKMDLAIGVAIGSSIQIALFVTPFIVLLGWCMGKPMSLYFTLFETVCLFVSAFIVNFLVLDGRSNYLEGALLICAYVIIAVAAFFYPARNDQSSLGGNTDAIEGAAEAAQVMANVAARALGSAVKSFVTL
jgi:Ca2+:H+ antiporter